ncbi:MAG: cupin domain-containing protein [Burkholderiales bacterium]|nr:cupin domain-containing protein [Anaerolineae bacterium]
MHHVSKIDHAAAQTPELYRGHSTGFQRATYVDRSAGSLHMGTGIVTLDSAGEIEPHVHAFEETFYILEGCVLVQIGDQSYTLTSGYFGLIPTGTKHAWRSAGDVPARWLEMQAPQPRTPDYGRDTYFVGSVGDVLTEAAPPDLAATAGVIGYFDEAQLPRPGAPAEMEGFNPITGVTIKMFVDRSFGAVHQSLFLIQYMPGAKIDPHDHAFEESYLIVSGRVEAVADGQSYDLGPGDCIWTSTGCIHSFANVGNEPVRWIETQAPLPPTKEVFRFERDWAQYK